MIKFLDFRIFGSGHGMGAPYFNQKFYWLEDTMTKHSTFYTWCGWFGSQLQSFQWTHPNAGERRLLIGHEFRPFNSARKLIRVRVSWRCDILKTSEDIKKFEHKLNEQT